MNKKSDNEFRCGWVALIGKPNIGKSTLLNRLVGQKISITSRRPQTTRHRILGVLTRDDFQVAIVDTPGIHADHRKYLNRIFNRSAVSSMDNVDLCIFLIDNTGWQPEDIKICQLFKKNKVPATLVINKIDRIKDKSKLLPIIEQSQQHYNFDAIIPISAKNGTGIDQLLSNIYSALPKGQADFPKELVTDRTFKFMAAELVREQIFRQLGDELPYTSAVEVESFVQSEKIVKVSVLIWVGKESHKPIFLGVKGERMKKIGTQARLQMQEIFNNKVYLQLWVKVREGWFESDLSIRNLGYIEQ